MLIPTLRSQFQFRLLKATGNLSLRVCFSGDHWGYRLLNGLYSQNCFKAHWKPQEIGCLSSKKQLKGFQVVILFLEMCLFCSQDGARVIRLVHEEKCG